METEARIGKGKAPKGVKAYTGIDDINGVVSAPNGEREIPPTSTSSQDVNHTNLLENGGETLCQVTWIPRPRM
jgi:hypothetical protein